MTIISDLRKKHNKTLIFANLLLTSRLNYKILVYTLTLLNLNQCPLRLDLEL